MPEKMPPPADVELTVAERLSLDHFEFDEEPFIKVDTRLCKDCKDKPCLWVCPAKVYRLEGDELVYDYEDCIELGACAIVCREIGNGAIKWSYPRGGYGVEFKFG